MLPILSAEWLKTKRTSVRWLTLLTPVVTAAVIIWYFSLKPAVSDSSTGVFQWFFGLWATIVIPLGAGLLPGIIIHQEELAGSFNGFLGSKLPRTSLYLGKLLLLIMLSTASTLLGTLLLVAGTDCLLNIPAPWPIFIAAAIMAALGTLPLLAMQLWASLAWGMGASIGIGGGGLLIAALASTSLGNRIWQFLPWAWPARLSILPGIYLLYQPGMQVPPPSIASGYPIHETIKGIIPAAVFFIVVLVGGITWFKKWEGRKIYE
ncbi:lantibiotic immunity ABC transporter MutG family permease subunit [Desulfotomaculum copahuensis]|uniref:Lantibiotic ABC transporter permease n=1 Tax=Desulfotomaculum copahuensis TaxID=1838280 RepID=A0A1B7LKR4_9FIRM|nr:lantibiotic immunity ABC transporter MutG family permease subunit [Desulfotomaculum copahuensis]OAT87130.1 lantibiotic ABC transporter permease [Desulfotomaculum copahuensis]